MFVEGARAAREACSTGADLRYALATERALMNELARECWETAASNGADRHLLTEREMRGISDTRTPQGFAVVCAEPASPLEAIVDTGLCLLLDRVRDPGNVGALVRSAAALGVGGVVALDGSADPWSTKAVRASAGMAFRVPVASAEWERVECAISAARATLMVADARGSPVPRTRPWPSRIALAIGSEPTGIRNEIRALASSTLAVPMRTGAESLNAATAGSLLMWEILRGGAGTPAKPARNAERP